MESIGFQDNQGSRGNAIVSNQLILSIYRTEDYYATIKTMHGEPAGPLYNMRHIHPVRQSGPIPPYDGPYTMEDVRKIYG